MSDEVQNLADEELAGTVEKAVREFLAAEGGVENIDALAADQELWAEFDSLLIMELLVHLEDRFNVKLGTGNLHPADLKTIARIRDAAVEAIRAATK